MTVTFPTAQPEHRSRAALVAAWIAFIQATEAHYQASVRHTERERRAVAERVADYGIGPPAGLAAERAVPAHRG
jgi:hypothetical protein